MSTLPTQKEIDDLLHVLEIVPWHIETAQLLIDRVKDLEKSQAPTQQLRVCLKRLITNYKVGSERKACWLMHNVEMPFLPPVGMELSYGDIEMTVESLYFSEKGIVFAFGSKLVATTANEYDKLVSDLCSYGWKKSKSILSIE